MPLPSPLSDVNSCFSNRLAHFHFESKRDPLKKLPFLSSALMKDSLHPLQSRSLPSVKRKG
jgi:hypothetical protein